MVTFERNSDLEPSVVLEYVKNRAREYPRDHLKFGPTLGEGAFGRVIRAKATSLCKNYVAVKMLKGAYFYI